MRSLPFALGCAVALGSACAPSELGPPGPAEVRLRAVGTSTLSLDRLRLAALYRNDEAVETSADVTITATGAVVLGTLTAPTIALPDRSTFQLRVGEQGVFEAQPVQFFGYLDADGSGDFSNGPDLTGPDVVVAAARRSPSYAWLPDLSTQLSSQAPETVESFYALTDGRYTSLLPFRTPTLGAPGMGAFATAPPTIVVSISSPVFARHTLLCGESGVGEGPTEVRVRVDPSAGGDTLCALDLPACETATVSELAAPELPLDDVDSAARFTTVQCRRSGRREALVVEERRLACVTSACYCVTTTRVDAIVTSTSAAPTWWPCGDTVDRCDSSLPLYRTDSACPG